MTYEKTESRDGYNYWLEHPNARDKYNPHKIKITVVDGIIKDYTCTCTHGTIQLSMKSNKTCTHIREFIKKLKVEGIIK